MKYNGNYVLNSRPPRTIVLPLPKNRNMLNSHSTSILPQASITTSPKSGLPTHAPIKPPVRKPMPPTAGPAVSSSPPVAFTLVNQAPTPAPALTPNTPKSPALGSNGAPDMQVQASPEACTNQAYPKDVVTDPDGPLVYIGTRADSQDPNSMRNADIAAAKQCTIANSLDFAEKVTATTGLCRVLRPLPQSNSNRYSKSSIRPARLTTPSRPSPRAHPHLA